MPLTLTFAPSQNQTFELRCDYGSRRLNQADLATLITQCQQTYFPKQQDALPDLIDLGKTLYHWLDGREGWIRRILETANPATLILDLTQTSDVKGLNPDTDRVALGLAHLPWELLHDGTSFLLERQDVSVLPVRQVQSRQTPIVPPQNRPLRVLFMATSPDYPGIAPLQFEQEEAHILEATQKQPLALVVEESGSVSELQNLVASYPADHFDVFHLTGHGVIYTQADFGFLLAGTGRTIPDHTPCFITEDDLGGVQLTTVADLARAFGDRFPRIVFLSGCHTGQVPNRGTVPSMAQALVKAGAAVVLGWARPVYDRTGIIAAKALYSALATGATVEFAVRSARQEMIAQRCPDWHLLRLYQDARPLAALVTPLYTSHRAKLRLKPAEPEFLDENQQVKVASRSEFVGRRRFLQRGLRALRATSDQIGVWIAGMGGLGKSTLAARLCTRMQSLHPEMAMVVLVGPLDESKLLNALSPQYERFAEIPPLLNQAGVSLNGRLQNFFLAIAAKEQPLLLVLDDFEQNIPTDDLQAGSPRLTTPAYDVLAALCTALEQTGTRSRLLVTCRYLDEATLPPNRLHKERLLPMTGADVEKKTRQLLAEATAPVQARLHEQRILQIADGNPRLLEWLVKLIQQTDLVNEDLLRQLEARQTEFRENILAQTLLGALAAAERQAVARLSVWQLPVSPELVTALALPVAALDRAASLSLVEHTPHPPTPSYRVSSLLAPLLEPALEPGDWHTAYQQAAQTAYRHWWEAADNPTEAQCLEMVRLALRGGETEIAVRVGDRIATRWVNQSRFLEALELCQQILQVVEDYRIWGTIARAEEVLGLVENALTHYQQALDHCPEADFERKAATLNNMADVVAQQGDIDRALQLWHDSLDIQERIGDVKGKAATLNNMALVVAQQGDIDRALQLWHDSLDIQERIGDVKGKAATLSNMAGVVAQHGDIDRALQLWHDSLDILERIGDVKGKAVTLSNMALVVAQHGDIDRALQLWHDSLDIKERIGDVKSKAATLNNMAGVVALQGDIDRALQLWHDSLDILERIGDVKGKAATLAWMAYIAGETGDKVRQLTLNLQAAQALAQVRAYNDLFTVLSNLGTSAPDNPQVYLAQALWLGLRIQTPLPNFIYLLRFFFHQVPQADELAALLATTALYFCQVRGKAHPQLAELQNASVQMLAAAAAAQGVDLKTMDDLGAWMAQPSLNDPQVFLPPLLARLEAMVGDGWLFDPNRQGA